MQEFSPVRTKMEYPFLIKNLLPEPIVIVDSKYSCIRRNKVDNYEQAKKNLSHVIDEMGAASSRAQGLKGCITTGMRLRCSDHRLYVLTDCTENKNAVAGILKVGVKKLFVMDLQNNQLEVNPLCVLDFYIHESKQRMGFGKKLFEFMLQNENVVAANLAFDRPSHKFLSFLKKHYDLKNPYQQVNNFVVFDLFFRDLQAIGYVQPRHRLTSTLSRPPLHPYRRTVGTNHLIDRPSGRHSASRPSPRTQTPQSQYHPIQTERTILPPINLSATSRCSSDAGRQGMMRQEMIGNENDAFNSNRGLGARASLYSRHTVTTHGSALGQKISSRPNSGQNVTESSPESHQNIQSKYPKTAETEASKIKETLATDVSDTGSSDLVDKSGNYTLTRHQPRRNLQMTSADNPLGNKSSHLIREGDPHMPTSTWSTSTLDQRNMFIRSAPVHGSRTDPVMGTQNYTVSSIYNSKYGPHPSFDSHWNIFGVPTPSKPTGARTMTSWSKGRTFHI